MVSVQQVYEAISDGLIDVKELEKSLQEQEEMSRRKEMLKCHKYAIIYDKRGDYYYTYLFDPTRKYNRRIVKRNDKVALEEFLIDYYKAEEPEFFSFKKMYEDWLAIKKNNIQPSTYDRYIHDYRRAFGDSEFEKMEIGKIDEYMIQDYISQLITEKSYTRKSIGNVFTIISGVFKYAKSKHMTELSISYIQLLSFPFLYS